MKNEEIATCLTSCLTSTYLHNDLTYYGNNPRKKNLDFSHNEHGCKPLPYLPCYHLLGIMALEYGGGLYIVLSQWFLQISKYHKITFANVDSLCNQNLLN